MCCWRLVFPSLQADAGPHQDLEENKISILFSQKDEYQVKEVISYITYGGIQVLIWFASSVSLEYFLNRLFWSTFMMSFIRDLTTLR